MKNISVKLTALEIESMIAEAECAFQSAMENHGPKHPQQIAAERAVKKLKSALYTTAEDGK